MLAAMNPDDHAAITAQAAVFSRIADALAGLAAPPTSPLIVAMSYAVAMRVLERIEALIHPAAAHDLLDEIGSGAVALQRRLAMVEAAAQKAAAISLTSPDRSGSGRTEP